LENLTVQPLSIKFISLKDRGNPPTYYRKLSTQSIQQQQKSKLEEKLKFRSNIQKLGIRATF
jgi:hypothetical protein